MTTSPVSLKSLIVASKLATVDFPGYDGFAIDVAFLSRDTLVTLRKKATKTTMKNRVTKEEINDELFLSLYTQAVVKGWKGLTFDILQKIAPIDSTGFVLTDELEYSEENALFLMKNSTEFDAFISDIVSDLGNFQKNSTAK